MGNLVCRAVAYNVRRADPFDSKKRVYTIHIYKGLVYEVF